MISLSIWFRLLRGLLLDVYYCLSLATIPTLRAIWNTPSILFDLRELSRTFMSVVWVPFGDGIDGNCRAEKEELIWPWARGVVLEIGAAHGHSARYLDRTHVTAYVALEPNVRMHGRLRRKAREAGFEEADGTLLVLSCGAEDVDEIACLLAEWAARKWGKKAKREEEEDGGRVVDTILSVLTLCSVPARPSGSTSSPPRSDAIAPSTAPADTIRALQTRVLRPGGQLLFYEHVRSPIPAVARAQDVLAPVWRMCFDGCTIGVDSVRAVWESGFERLRDAGDSDGMEDSYASWTEDRGVRSWKARGEEVGGGGWAEMYAWGKEGEEPASLFWHQSGRCVKKLGVQGRCIERHGPDSAPDIVGE